MPLIEGHISELTDDIAVKLEKEVTTAIGDSVAKAFPPELGLSLGSKEYQIAFDVARRIMPGWTWITMVRHQWAIQGQRQKNIITARIHILVLQNALEPQYKDHILQAVTKTVKRILSAGGKKVSLAVSISEGGVDMTLPLELFGDMTHGAEEEVLQAANVRTFLITEIMKIIQAHQQPAS